MTGSADEPIVTYTVREIVESIDAKLATIDAKLDTKASQADLDALAAKLDTKASQADLGDLLGEVAEIKTWRAKAIGFAFGASVAAGGVGASIAKALGVV